MFDPELQPAILPRDTALVWEDYSKAEWDRSLYRDLSVARSLQSRFRGIGITLDAMYVECVALPSVGAYSSIGASTPPLMDILAAWHRQLALDSRPVGLRELGYDVAWPVPKFHSVIHEGHLAADAPKYLTKLNRNGLFSSLSTARAALLATTDPRDPQFGILRVWETVVEQVPV